MVVNQNRQGKLQVRSIITSTEGLVGNVVRWLIVDKGNYLYAGTNLGLNRIDLNLLYKSKKVRINFLDKDQGYFDCTGKTASLDDEGNIWVGTDSRLLKINTSLFQKTQSALQPVIYKVEVDNASFTFRNEANNQKWQPSIPDNYTFSYDQNSLTFYFKVVNFSDPENICFRTKLEGLNKNWTAYSLDSKSVFTGLNPGNYKLKIESYSHLDNSVIGTTEYSFSIATPSYRTWWFISLMSLIFITIIWLLYHFRVRDIRKQEKQKSDLQREASNMEMKALQAQMKPHFIFNAINSIQSYIIDNDVDKALHYLSMFSKLIRKTLLNASKEFIPLEEELEYLNFYIEIEKMRFEGLFTYEQIVHPEILPEAILIPPMIVQPFVENAIKHGLMKKKENCKLLIEIFNVGSHHFKFIVQDNGVGRIQSNGIGDLRNAHQSKGMQIVAERLNLLNGKHQTNAYQMKIIDLADEHGKPAGTRIEITFPIVEC
jgi:cbb3-type cytochrome oxidase subunit 3